MSVCAMCAFRYGGSASARSNVSAVRLPYSIRCFSTTTSQRAKPQKRSSKSDESPKAAAAPPPPPQYSASGKLLSSVAAGTPLKGINYIKKLTDPVALPDEEYPDWLWKALEDRRPTLSANQHLAGDDAADLYSKSKTRRKQAAKRIAARANTEIVVDVPADHRTEDMPYETYEESSAAIMEAKKASRARRRAGIKERNFLGQLG